jgi:hypothetical protein
LLQTVPSALSEAAAGLGYGWDSVVLLSLAQFLRNAGYKALPSLNDTALAIPYAVQVRKTALFEPFIYKMHYFTKTGSGQT